MTNSHNNEDVHDRRQLFNQCRVLAENPYILQELDRQLVQSGFAGSTKIPLTIFLASLTRMFPQPVSCIIKGPSSSGKSFALKAALQFVPEEACHVFHGLSAKALPYAAKNTNFQNKIIVIQELAGMAEEGFTLLRQLISEGMARHATVNSTSRSGFEGKNLEIRGPVSVLMTTTERQLHHEDETRFLSLHVDQSANHRREMIMSFSDTPRVVPQDVMTAWHSLHRYVCNGSLDVKIPYRSKLLRLFPTNIPRVLRDIPKVLALIRAHALLHQQTREKEGATIVANHEDYAMVFRLIANEVAQGLQDQVTAQTYETVSKVIEIASEQNGLATQAALAKALSVDQTTISRRLRVAIGEGYVKPMGRPGRELVYVAGEMSLPSSRILPRPEDLEEECRHEFLRKRTLRDDLVEFVGKQTEPA